MTNNLMLAISGAITQFNDHRVVLKKKEITLGMDKKRLQQDIEEAEMRVKNIIAFDKELKNAEQREVKTWELLKQDAGFMAARAELNQVNRDLDYLSVELRENQILTDAKNREWEVYRLAAMETIADKGLRV